MVRKPKYEISSSLGGDSELGNEKEHIGGYGGDRHVSGTFVGRQRQRQRQSPAPKPIKKIEDVLDSFGLPVENGSRWTTKMWNGAVKAVQNAYWVAQSTAAKKVNAFLQSRNIYVKN